MDKIKIALAGCGAIANGMHLPGIQTMQEMELVELVAVSDMVVEKAEETAARFAIPQHFGDVETMLTQADFDLLVNTTVIPSHFEVTLAGLQAGKHVYTQKPMSVTLDEANQLVEASRRYDRRLAVAPEHPVRPHLLEMRRMIDEGVIGTVAFARIQTSHHGPEKHNTATPRDSTWFYKPGSDPIMDLGVHGLSQITALLGPVRRLSAMSGRSLPVRHITKGPLTGKRIDVEIDDNSLLMLDFGDARFVMLDATYCVAASLAPRLEVFGSEGTLAVTYARRLGGAQEPTLHLYRAEDDEWQQVAVDSPPPVRDLGVLHLVESLQRGQPHLLTAERGRHLVEIITAAPVAAREGRSIILQTTF